MTDGAELTFDHVPGADMPPRAPGFIVTIYGDDPGELPHLLEGIKIVGKTLKVSVGVSFEVVGIPPRGNISESALETLLDLRGQGIIQRLPIPERIPGENEGR